MSCAYMQIVWAIGLKLENKIMELQPYVSVNWVIIDAGDGWSPVEYRAISWTKVDLLPTEPIRTNQWISNQIWLFQFTHKQ